MMRAALAAALVAATFAAGCGGGGTPGTIVYQTSDGGRAILHAANPDGSASTRLPLELPATDAGVFWARDGKKALVVVDAHDRSTTAYVFEPASGKRLPIRVPDVGFSMRHRLRAVSERPWSPDGKHFVLGTNQWDVVVDLATSVRHHLGDELTTGALAWSADSKDVLFPVGRDIVAAPADGGEPRRLVRLTGFLPSGVQQSADGKWLAFAHYGYQGELYVVRSDGTGLRRISHDAKSFAWSPNGEQLAFADPSGIVVADVGNGSSRRLVTERLGDPANERPAWSPDGRRILYWSDDFRQNATSGHARLWTMKVDGTDRRPVTQAFPFASGGQPAVWVAAALK
jgi:Tol biopolymer transport system component